MTRARRRNPLAGVESHLEGLGALEAARRLLHPDGALADLLEATTPDVTQLVLDAFEAKSHDAETRKKNGVFYTPEPVVRAMLDRVPLDGHVLDPACGAGAFLVGVARRLGAAGLPRLHACDISADALDCAAIALEAALGSEHADAIARWRRTNAHQLDFLRDAWPGPRPSLIVGNPPYGHGGGDDLARRFPPLAGEIDLYACFLLQAVKLVGPGTVALLVPDTWLTNRDAAALRRALVERTDLARLVDFGKPFASARDTRVHALVLRRGAPRCEVESTRDDRLEPMAPASRDSLRDTADRGWFLYRTEAEARACAALERTGQRVGDAFDVLYGLRTGSNATHVHPGDGDVPLVGGLDFEPYDRAWRPKHLVDPAAFERVVKRQQGRWKIGIQRIRTNSRVPWRRWVEGALVSPREVGLDSLTLVADAAPAAEPSEALLCALGVLNSSVLNRWYKLRFTDVNVKPVYVSELPLPPPSPALAAAVRKRLESQGDLALERKIDRLVADAYGLGDEDLGVLERGFWGDALARRPMPQS